MADEAVAGGSGTPGSGGPVGSGGPAWRGGAVVHRPSPRDGV